MKIYDSHYEDYILNECVSPLHPKLHRTYDMFPNELKDLKNIIFYGPKGVGKYTQMLRSILKYSPSELKYDRKIINSYGKTSYVLKISDIHFEIDMSILGCNSKTLWNDLYSDIIDVIEARQTHTGIIVCKYFHEIHSDLLDCFYSYMQTRDNAIDIKFILLTEHLSFIPDNIVDTCKIIRVPRPTKQQYKRCLKFKKDKVNIHEITNMKNVKSCVELMQPYKIICNDILDDMITPEQINYVTMRDKLYDLLIYSLDVTECIWYILHTCILGNFIPNEKMSDVMLETYRCLHYYNNNYRPIYHLERFVFYLINTIHGFAESN